MNVNTLIVSAEQAQAKLKQYERIQKQRRTVEDEALHSLYAAVSKGARCLNIAEAFKQTGVNEQHQPKLAIARADWKTVHCFRNPGAFTNTVAFGPQPLFNPRAINHNIRLPSNTYNWPMTVNPMGYSYPAVKWNQLRTAVPHIPPAVRPRIGLHNFHVLFEVKQWEAYNVDPFLLRHIGGFLFVVMAEWELTELEASLLGSLTGN
jgi:hypothetical protein